MSFPTTCYRILYFSSPIWWIFLGMTIVRSLPPPFQCLIDSFNVHKSSTDSTCKHDLYSLHTLCDTVFFLLLRHSSKVQEQLITLCFRANSSSCDLNVASCSFITSVLTLATFSPTSRNWSWKFTATLYFSSSKRAGKKESANVKSISRKTGHTRVAAAFCKPAIPGRLLMLSGGVIYLHKQAQFAPQKF